MKLQDMQTEMDDALMWFGVLVVAISGAVFGLILWMAYTIIGRLML